MHDRNYVEYAYQLGRRLAEAEMEKEAGLGSWIAGKGWNAASKAGKASKGWGGLAAQSKAMGQEVKATRAATAAKAESSAHYARPSSRSGAQSATIETTAPGRSGAVSTEATGDARLFRDAEVARTSAPAAPAAAPAAPAAAPAASEGAAQAQRAAASGADDPARWFNSASPEAQETFNKTLGGLRSAGSRMRDSYVAAPLALGAAGAGVGYAADGQEGALRGGMIGAGLGLGGRLGARGYVNRRAELRGLQKALKKSPNAELSARAAESAKMVPGTVGGDAMSQVAGRGMLGAGVLGAGGAVGGNYLGQSFAPQEAPWYQGGGFGLNQVPGRMGEFANAAAPLVQQYRALQAPQMSQGMGYY